MVVLLSYGNSSIGIDSLFSAMILVIRTPTRHQVAFTRLLVGCFRSRYPLIITGVSCFLVDFVVWCQPQRTQIRYSSHVASVVKVLQHLAGQLR